MSICVINVRDGFSIAMLILQMGSVKTDISYIILFQMKKDGLHVSGCGWCA